LETKRIYNIDIYASLLNTAGSLLMKKSALILLLVLFLTACGTTSPATQPAEKPQPPAAPTQVPAATEVQPAVPPTLSQPVTNLDGAKLLQDRCADCHSPDKVKDRPQTKDQWNHLVANMINRGANLNDAEKQALVDYLAQTYGK
jgi:mono/diheme cytochrome c family protein